MKHKNVCYENCYKYKLNMLEPGLVMMKIIGILFLCGIIFRAVGWYGFSVIALFLAGGIFAVLLILVAIELHQDKVLNDIAMREMDELEGRHGIR